MKGKVIDVSAYQGDIDWAKVKNAGVDGVALKIIRKDLTPDKKFEEYYTGCQKNNIAIVGVYNYSYATTASKARTDAKAVIETLNGRKIKVYLDVENDCQKNLGTTLVDIINAYKAVIEGAGLEFGVYTGLSFYNSFIKPYAKYINCKFWIARYPSTVQISVSATPNASKQPVINHVLEGWQYSSKGIVPGISGNVDLDEWYGDIPKSSTSSEGCQYPIPTRVIYYKKPIMMKGDDVKWIQHHLIRLGFLAEKNSKGKTNIDGYAGKDFDTAVRKAQTYYGVVVDGKVGAETREVLRWN